MNTTCITAEVLTYGPFRLLVMGVYLPRQFPVHLVETLDCICNAIGHFEMVAESAVNRESWGCKLQTKGVSTQRGNQNKRDRHIESSNQGIFPRSAFQF